MIASVSGCGEKHEHVFLEATCEEAAVCECGEVDGEPLGHDYAEATCQSPKTCTRCGDTIGEPTEHIYGPRLINQASTCEICGDTVGEPIELHQTRSQIDSWQYNFDVEKRVYGDNMK